MAEEPFLRGRLLSELVFRYSAVVRKDAKPLRRKIMRAVVRAEQLLSILQPALASQNNRRLLPQ